jgi:hypothetical protein
MDNARWGSAPDSERSGAMTEYVQFGAFLITVPNLIVVIVMLIVFALGLWLRLPGHQQEQEASHE